MIGSVVAPKFTSRPVWPAAGLAFTCLVKTFDGNGSPHSWGTIGSQSRPPSDADGVWFDMPASVTGGGPLPSGLQPTSTNGTAQTITPRESRRIAHLLLISETLFIARDWPCSRRFASRETRF